MNKKIFAVVLAVCMMVCLCACNGGGNGGDAQQPETTTTTNNSWNNNWNNDYTEPYYCSEMNPQDVVGEWVRITSSSANVRKGPGTNYDQLGYVRENQIFFVYDWSNGNTGHYWLKIYWNNTYAWINSGTCTLSN